MAKKKAPAKIKSVSDLLADDFIMQEVDLQRFASKQRKDVRKFLKKLQKDLEEQIAKIGTPKGDTSELRLNRLQTLLEQTEATIKTSYSKAKNQHRSQLIDLADVVATKTADSVNAAIGSSVFSVALTPSHLTRIADDTLIQGSPSKDWWSRQAASTRNRFADEIRMGVAQGESIPNIVQRVSSVINASRAQAEALVRSSVQAINNKARFDIYKANDDVVEGVEALATLDTRTSDICKARDGGAWSLSTGKPLPGSTVQEDFPGPPPWHWNCRTTLVPITFSWKELGVKTQKEIPASTRAAMDGEVSATKTYEQWLKSQPKAVQLEALGPGKWQAWKKGGLTLQQMVDQTGRPLTVKQLQAKTGQVKKVVKKAAKPKPSPKPAGVSAPAAKTTSAALADLKASMAKAPTIDAVKAVDAYETTLFKIEDNNLKWPGKKVSLKEGAYITGTTTQNPKSLELELRQFVDAKQTGVAIKVDKLEGTAGYGSSKFAVGDGLSVGENNGVIIYKLEDIPKVMGIVESDNTMFVSLPEFKKHAFHVKSITAVAKTKQGKSIYQVVLSGAKTISDTSGTGAITPVTTSIGLKKAAPKAASWRSILPDKLANDRLLFVNERGIKRFHADMNKKPPKLAVKTGGDYQGFNGFRLPLSEKSSALSKVDDAVKDSRIDLAKTPFKNTSGYKKAIDSRLKDVLSTSDVRMRIRPQSLSAVLTDGRFKTQWHKGAHKSYGNLTGNHRAAIEKQVMGVPSKANPNQRPVYAYVTDPDKPFGINTDDLNSYGELSVKLKPSVRKRTTVTFNDSAEAGVFRTNQKAPMVGTPINQPGLESAHLDLDTLVAPASVKSVDDLHKLGLADEFGFIEAQIHKGLMIADIESVTFPKRLKGKPQLNDLVRSLKRRNIKVEYK